MLTLIGSVPIIVRSRRRFGPTSPSVSSMNAQRGARPLVSIHVLLLAFLAGCSSGDRTLAEVDPDAAPANPTYDQVYAILDRNCVPCHKGGSNSPQPLTALIPREDGEGGDDGFPHYDSCEGIQEDLDGIIDTAIEEGSMPPGAWPRLDERERLIISRWIEQGACSPCTSCP
jgi:uncharacterized membrane protein